MTESNPALEALTKALRAANSDLSEAAHSCEEYQRMLDDAHALRMDVVAKIVGLEAGIAKLGGEAMAWTRPEIPGGTDFSKTSGPNSP